MSNLQSINMFGKLNVFISNLKFGYTQGELNEDFEDFDDAFNAHKHVYWTYTVISDNNETADEKFFLIDWSNNSEYSFKTQIELVNKIGELCSSSSEDMFGSVIIDQAFSGIAMYALDEDAFKENGYDSALDIVLEEIGGSVEENWEGCVPEEFVNSLFCLYEGLLEDAFSVENGELMYQDNKFDAEDIFDEEGKIIYFTNDVMNY